MSRTWADVSAFIKSLDEAKRRRVMPACVRAIDQLGEHVIGDAQELAPVDTGALKASATTLPAQEKGTMVTKEIGFNTSYAAAVHENLEAHHDQGEAKYLEKATNRNQDNGIEFVMAEMNKAL